MKQYKAKEGSIIDADTGDVVAVVQELHCGRKMRNKMAKYVVEKLNCEERGKAAARAHKEN